MAETSPSNASDSAGSVNTSITTPGLDILARPPIKRARPQLSCTPCRQGKLKCNREHPVCDQCIKRSRDDACTYVPPPPKNKQTQNMRGRIRNLESLVVNLMNQKGQASGNTSPQDTNGSAKTTPTPATSAPTPKKPTDEELNPDSFGHLRISNTGYDTSYVGASHWSSLLKEIEEVKDILEEQDEGEDDAVVEETWEEANQRSTVTFGVARPTTKAGLLAEMPPKDEVDRLIPLWFNSSDPLLYIIHTPTFQEEYKQFWKDPSSVPVMWIALLYGAMALGIILGPRNPGMNAYAAAYDRSTGSMYDRMDKMASSPSVHTVDKYQSLASSALALADVAKSQPYTLEALMIYGECEFLRRDDHHVKIWLMEAVMMRVALRMGYHRDPKHFKNITPFQGEMRRRLWHVLNMMDILVSFAIGLPSMVRRIESDTQLPLNLFDSDLSSDMTELPKERPSSEITPGSYTIIKALIFRYFADAAEISQRVVPPQHVEIMAVDKRVREAYERIPDGLRVKPLGECIMDSPTLIMSRFNIELLYQKTRTLLHRRYLTLGQTDPRFEAHRRTCVEAAIETLRQQVVIFHACQPGGQLHKVWWYMSSLTTYDFLLAAMVVCLEANYLRQTESAPGFKGEKCPMLSTMLELLETTYDIWANHPNRLSESIRAADILRAMLKKCQTPTSSNAPLNDPVPNGLEQNIAKSPDVDFDFSTNLEAIPQTWDIPNGENNLTDFNMADIAQDIDWTMWDSNMQNQTNTIPQQTWDTNMNFDPEAWLNSGNNLGNAMDLQGTIDLLSPNLYNGTNPSG